MYKSKRSLALFLCLLLCIGLFPITAFAASSSVVITTQPKDYIGEIGATAKFSVVAQGEGLTYKWQFKKAASGSLWTTSTSSKTNTLSVEITEARDGQSYRCIVTDKNGKSVTSDIGKIIVGNALKITTQPKDYIGAIGTTAKFSVVAQGEGLTYKWQFKKAASGSLWTTSTSSKTNTLSVEITEARDGQSYRCIITDKNGSSITSNIGKIIVGSALKITTQPKDYIGAIGTTAKFSVVAQGEGLTYKWQFKKAASGSLWTTSTSSKTNTLNVDITDARDGQSYRCIITDKNGNSITSDIGKIIVGSALKITTQPKDYIGAIGTTAKFSVVAQGEGLTYKWQFKKAASGSLWTTSTSSKTNTLSVEITEARDGQSYRCIITDKNGSSITSNIGKIIVGSALKITTQPKDYIGAIGTTAKFSVVAQGEGLTYKWQFKKAASGSLWTTSTSSKTNTLNVDITDARDGQSYRCIITDKNGNSITSDIGKIIVGSALKITTQPKDYIGAIGTTAKFSVVAQGEGLTYKWQFKKAASGSLWTTSTSSKTNTLSVEITEARDGQSYRCIVTDKNGNSVTSAIGKVIVGSALKITTQPKDYIGAIGTTAKFSVVAQGEGLTYKWQYKVPNGTVWNTSSTKTSTYTTEATAARNGQSYRCIITDKNGNSVTTNIVRLVVKTELKITTQPKACLVTAGDMVRFTVTAQGEDLSYQWENKAVGGDWTINSDTGNKTNSISFTATEDKDGWQYRCVIKDNRGSTVTSESAALSVEALSNDPTLVAQAVTAAKGSQSVQLTVSIRNNPSIMGLYFSVEFDESVLTLKSARSGAAMSAFTFCPPGVFKSGLDYSWDAQEIKPSDIKNGEVLILTFDVSPNAAVGTYPVKLVTKGDSAFNVDFEYVTLAVTNGGIEVK